jgi:subtilase family serine protease
MAVVTNHAYRGSIMSQSFGEPDDLVTCTGLDPTGTYCISYDPTLLNNCLAEGCPNQVFQIAEKNHWTVIASSGDDGANEDGRVLGTGELTPSFPSTSPLVLAAGGTQGNPYGGQYGAPPGPGGTLSCGPFKFCNTGLLIINGGLNGCGTAARPGEPSSCVPISYGGESAWNEFNTFQSLGSSTGGGISMLYSRPSFQDKTPDSYTTLFGNSVSVTGRTTPDVSFNSASVGGVLAYLGFLGRWAVFGGTSAASPAWAAIIALLNQANGDPVGFITPTIYALAESSHGFGFGFFGPFHDITSGENSDTAGANTYCFPGFSPPFCVSNFDGFTAAHGYDLTTGWGTPNVSAFIQGIQQFLQDGNSH